jgi:hypothetical protein
MFRLAAIPHDVEQPFSKRFRAIEEAARIQGHSTARGMDLPTCEPGLPSAPQE